MADDILKHLSVSSLQTYARCGIQWYFRYVEGKKTPPSGAMVRGSSFHKGIEENFKQKITSKKDLPADQIKELISSDFDERIREAKLEEDETPGDLKDDAIKIVLPYYNEVAVKTQPVAVESGNTIEVAGYPLLSYIDILDDKNIIHDTKTKGKSPNKDEADLSMQLTAYDYTFRKVNGKKPKAMRLDCAVATKEPKVVVLETQPRSDLQVAAFEREVDLTINALRKEVFLPAKADDWCCSAKWCGYFFSCAFGWKRRAR